MAADNDEDDEDEDDDEDDRGVSTITRGMRTLSTQVQTRNAQPLPQRTSMPQAAHENEDEDQETVTIALQLRALNSPGEAQRALNQLQQNDMATNRDRYPRVIAYLRRTATR